MHGGGRRYVDEKSVVRREENVWNRDFVLIADGEGKRTMTSYECRIAECVGTKISPGGILLWEILRSA